MIRTVLSTLALALALAAVPSAAEAGWPGSCGYYGNSHFYGLWGNPYVYSQGAAYIPPYYAIHPPVYYSPFLTARSYGASPYAWCPAAEPLAHYTMNGVSMGGAASGYAAAAPAAEPLMIENPHVRRAAAKPADKAPVAEAKPMMIENPYFVSK
jgi:hypothetical protein